jgi:hypothetical protein
MNTCDMLGTVQAAWSVMPAPPKDEMRAVEREGEDAIRTFIGVAPTDVDVESGGFDVTTPLLDLPPRAAAAYLGTFLISLLRGLDFQERVGFFDDVLSRAHTILCMTDERFWRDVIRKELPPRCVDAAEQVARFLTTRRDELALTQEQVDTLLRLAAPPIP